MARQLPLSPNVEMYEMMHHSTALFNEAMLALIKAEFLLQTGRGSWDQREGAVDALAELVGHTMTLSDLTGRRRVFLNTAREPAPPAMAPTMFADSPIDRIAKAAGPVDPGLDFVEAIRDIVNRTPQLAEDVAPGVPRYLAVQDIYMDGPNFALAKANSLEVTQRVQKAIADGIEKGVPVTETRDIIAETGDWSKAYGQVVYRTNLNTAYTEGRFQQLKDPVIRRIVGAFEFSSINDNDTRTNHQKCDGLIAAVDSTIWNRYKTPIGYNCRCDVVEVTRSMLERLDLIQPNGAIRSKWGDQKFDSDQALEAAMRSGGAFPDEKFGRGGGPNPYAGRVIP